MCIAGARRSELGLFALAAVTAAAAAAARTSMTGADVKFSEAMSSMPSLARGYGDCSPLSTRVGGNRGPLGPPGARARSTRAAHPAVPSQGGPRAARPLLHNTGILNSPLAPPLVLEDAIQLGVGLLEGGPGLGEDAIHLAADVGDHLGCGVGDDRGRCRGRGVRISTARRRVVAPVCWAGVWLIRARAGGCDATSEPVRNGCARRRGCLKTRCAE